MLSKTGLLFVFLPLQSLSRFTETEQSLTSG